MSTEMIRSEKVRAWLGLIRSVKIGQSEGRGTVIEQAPRSGSCSFKQRQPPQVVGKRT